MASADFSHALPRETSPGKVHSLSARAARLYQTCLFGDTWISRSLGRSSPMPGLTADSCSCGRAFASRFLQLHLTATPCGSLRVIVTFPGHLLSDDKTVPMPGTLGCASAHVPNGMRVLTRALATLIPAAVFAGCVRGVCGRPGSRWRCCRRFGGRIGRC